MSFDAYDLTDRDDPAGAEGVRVRGGEDHHSAVLLQNTRKNANRC